MIRAKIVKASEDLSGAVRDFESVEEMFAYMRETYNEWIVEFTPDEDNDIELTIYDAYVE